MMKSIIFQAKIFMSMKNQIHSVLMLFTVILFSSSAFAYAPESDIDLGDFATVVFNQDILIPAGQPSTSIEGSWGSMWTNKFGIYCKIIAKEISTKNRLIKGASYRREDGTKVKLKKITVNLNNKKSKFVFSKESVLKNMDCSNSSFNMPTGMANHWKLIMDIDMDNTELSE